VTFEPMMTAAQVAKYLNVTRDYLYRELIVEIPHMKVGREYRFHKSEIDAWLNTTRGGVPLKYLEVA
jgi:excisionase family DNA binding protein